MSRRLWLMAAAGALMAAGGPLLAHHAFSAEFDANAPVTLRGPITKVEWINPHAWIHVEVKKPDGKSEIWMVEGGTPNTLQRGGITRDSIKIGTVIVVAGYQAKDGRMRANGRDITFPDGRTLFMGSSGTGAPEDGRDPNDRAQPKNRGADMRARPDRLCRSLAVALALTSACGARHPSAVTGVPRAAHDRRAPDLNGIWQAINTANWNLEDSCRAPGPGRRAGRRVQRPAGIGVVDGGEIPYQPAALAQKQENAADWMNARPRGQVLSARSSARHLHAVSVSDRPVARARS